MIDYYALLQRIPYVASYFEEYQGYIKSLKKEGYSMYSFSKLWTLTKARILDIHYPNRSFAALLVHNDYAPDFQKLLESKRVHITNNFGPISKDPQYKDMNNQDHNLKAAEFQRQRMQRAINHIWEPIKYALAHYFYQQQWITKEFLNQLISHTVNQQMFLTSMACMLLQTIILQLQFSR